MFLPFELLEVDGAPGRCGGSTSLATDAVPLARAILFASGIVVSFDRVAGDYTKKRDFQGDPNHVTPRRRATQQWQQELSLAARSLGYGAQDGVRQYPQGLLGTVQQPDLVGPSKTGEVPEDLLG